MGKKTLLVVDDDSDLLGALIIRLRASGYNVISATDAVQATAQARREQPDLVLLDIGLPAGNGFLVLERMKMNQQTASIPVIVITGRDPQESRDRSLRAGAAAFFQKPVDNAELLAAISDALGENVAPESRTAR